MSPVERLWGGTGGWAWWAIPRATGASTRRPWPLTSPVAAPPAPTPARLALLLTLALTRTLTAGPDAYKGCAPRQYANAPTRQHTNAPNTPTSPTHQDAKTLIVEPTRRFEPFLEKAEQLRAHLAIKSGAEPREVRALGHSASRVAFAGTAKGTTACGRAVALDGSQVCPAMTRWPASAGSPRARFVSTECPGERFVGCLVLDLV